MRISGGPHLMTNDLRQFVARRIEVWMHNRPLVSGHDTGLFHEREVAMTFQRELTMSRRDLV